MNKTTLGQELITSIEEALNAKESGKIVRRKIDIASIREKLDMTQRQFAAQYHINLQTLRNWEQGKRQLDATSLAYLICIAKKPRLIGKLLNTNT